MKTYKPITPSRRHLTTVDYKKVLTKKEPEKSLVFGFKRNVGRSKGRITTRHKGGGNKKLYRLIDFKFVDKKDIPAKVVSIEYDPFRSGFIALVVYKDGEKRYILAPKDLKVGSTIITSENAPFSPGNRLLLKNIPIGFFVYNVELKPNEGAKMVRSAGSFAQVVANSGDGYTQLKLPSGEIRMVSENCWASIGSVSNEEHNLVTIGKAGRSRYLGIRPTVRGSAMNPVDHPYGGGEGRQGRGTRYPKTAWGKITGGRKTRKVKKYSNRLIISRRPKKKKK